MQRPGGRRAAARSSTRSLDDSGPQGGGQEGRRHPGRRQRGAAARPAARHPHLEQARSSVRSPTTRSRACSGTSISGASSSSVDAMARGRCVMSSPDRGRGGSRADVPRAPGARLDPGAPRRVVPHVLARAGRGRPAREVPAPARRGAGDRRAAHGSSASTTRSSCSGGTGSTHFVRGDLGHEHAHAAIRCRRMIGRALVADAAADVLGARSSRWSSRSLLGVYSAVKQYSVGDYVVHRPLVRRHRDARRSGSGCSRSSLLVTWPDGAGSTSTSRSSIRSGLHSDGQTGLNLDYFRHLVLPGARR